MTDLQLGRDLGAALAATGAGAGGGQSRRAWWGMQQQQDAAQHLRKHTPPTAGQEEPAADLALQSAAAHPAATGVSSRSAPPQSKLVPFASPVTLWHVKMLSHVSEHASAPSAPRHDFQSPPYWLHESDGTAASARARQNVARRIIWRTGSGRWPW